jgi:hypothetical protein
MFSQVVPPPRCVNREELLPQSHAVSVLSIRFGKLQVELQDQEALPGAAARQRGVRREDARLPILDLKLRSIKHERVHEARVPVQQLNPDNIGPPPQGRHGLRPLQTVDAVQFVRCVHA